MARAFIGFGSNLGDRRRWLARARAALAAHPGVTVRSSSPLYESAPVGGPSGQDPYLNAVVEVAVSLSPQQLLAACQEVEASLGRERLERWGPRTIDLDLLLYDDLVIAEPDLTLPHPRLHQRRFVLLPLAELAPGLRHPLLGQTAEDLASGPFPGQPVRLVALRW